MKNFGVACGDGYKMWNVAERAQWAMQRGEVRAAVKKAEEKRR